MGQIILVGSYIGPSTYTFEVQVRARALSIDEVRQFCLVDDDALRRDRDSNYSREWFEVEPGDRITVRATNTSDEDEMIEEMEFEIPKTLPLMIPQKLDDRFKTDLLEWLKEHCIRVR